MTDDEDHRDRLAEELSRQRQELRRLIKRAKDLVHEGDSRRDDRVQVTRSKRPKRKTRLP